MFADKAELKALRIKKFMNNIKIKELKLEWIYIATTDQYAKERLFKIGSTERLMSRIAPYNTGRPKEDDYYYVWAMKCYNCKDLDQHIQKLLANMTNQVITNLQCHQISKNYITVLNLQI